MNDKSFKITLGAVSALTLLFSAFCFYYGVIPGVLCFGCGAAVATTYIVYTKKRFKKIEE